MNEELIGTISGESELKGTIEDNALKINVTIMETGAKGDKGDTAEILPATANTLGGIKVGSGLLVEADGTLSVDKSQIHELPAGGESNQVIKKLSDADYDYGWGDSVKIEAYGASLKII